MIRMMFGSAILAFAAWGSLAGQANQKSDREDPGPRTTSQQATRPQRERDAEPAYRQAVRQAATLADADDRQSQDQVLDLIETALQAGACPTRTLTESSFASLHSVQRFRELIRDHAHQSAICLTLPDEPGERLRVEGVVRDSAGHPLVDALVYAYHTDARGLYSAAGMDESNPRIFGYLRTDEEGRFAFRTIRPGYYPDQDEPVEQHIHFEVTAAGREAVQVRLGFADDPFWTGKRIPRWVGEVTDGDDGEKVCRFEIKLGNAR